MRIIFLNVWGGMVGTELDHFIAHQSASADIFCFQETHDAAKTRFDSILSNYESLHVTKDTPSAYREEGEVFANATYVKKGIEILSHEAVLQHECGIGLGLRVYIRSDVGNLSICNIHGVAAPGDKLDTPERIAQSKAILASQPDQSAAVIGGDFNVMPNTQSINLFAERSYRNLISEYGITNTRNELTWKKYSGNKQYFADYAFVSPHIPVTSFTVPYNEISDHLPLILEI